MNLTKDKEWIVYANEADILNVALFGMTAKQWKETNTDAAFKNLNIRDVADAHQLLVLSNLESLNAGMIQAGADKNQRLITLRQNAIFQLNSLRNSVYTLDKIESPFSSKIKQKDISNKSTEDAASVSSQKNKK